MTRNEILRAILDGKTLQYTDRIDQNPWTMEHNHVLHHVSQGYSLTGFSLAPEIVEVNGFSINKWLSVIPKINDLVFVVSPAWNDFYFETRWNDCKTDNFRFERGMIHSSKEDAIAHAKALCGIDPQI